ncbi:hypothetical protein C8R46DRAFT_1341814 [Mycena filopes]|nr:hypothetical protein C8R46DRAFT_1341814 [Mycena filopes]
MSTPAPAPFSGQHADDDDLPAPDIILRSSDAPLAGAGTVVLQLAEPAALLYPLLTYAYPAATTQSLQLADLAQAHDLLIVADKYLMGRVERLIASAAEGLPCTTAQAPALFVLGVARNNQLMGRAAHLTLNDLVPTALPAAPMAIKMPDEALWALQTFHAHCGDMARALVRLTAASLEASMLGYEDAWAADAAAGIDYVWWNDEGHAPGCGAVWGPFVEGFTEVLPAQWFRNHVARVEQSLALRPNGRTAERLARSVHPAEQVLIDACPLCSQVAEGQLRGYAARLGAMVERTNVEETNKFWQCDFPQPPVEGQDV